MTISIKKSTPAAGPVPVQAPISPLSALEISGAMCAVVVHDLANLISGILGNAEYAQGAETSPENLQKALAAIGQAANSAGKILGRSLPLQRLLSAEAVVIDADELARRICEAATYAPGWRAESTSRLTGQLRVQPRWLIAALWQIACEAQVQRGEIVISCGPSVFPVIWRRRPDSLGPVDLFQVEFNYRSEEMMFTAGSPVNPERFGLFAASELIRRFRGQIDARPKPPGRQQISVLLPLV